MEECTNSDIMFSMILGLALALFFGHHCKNGECIIIDKSNIVEKSAGASPSKLYHGK